MQEGNGEQGRETTLNALRKEDTRVPGVTEYAVRATVGGVTFEPGGGLLDRLGQIVYLARVEPIGDKDDGVSGGILWFCKREGFERRADFKACLNASKYWKQKSADLELIESLDPTASAPVRTQEDAAKVCYRDRGAEAEEGLVSTWESAQAEWVDCCGADEHSALVMDPETLHTLGNALHAEEGRSPIGVYMLWQPEGSAFVAKPGMVLGSLTFGQTFAVRKSFVEPRYATWLYDVAGGGSRVCNCVHGRRPEGEYVADLGLRELESYDVWRERETRKALAKEKADARKVLKEQERVTALGRRGRSATTKEL